MYPNEINLIGLYQKLWHKVISLSFLRGYSSVLRMLFTGVGLELYIWWFHAQHLDFGLLCDGFTIRRRVLFTLIECAQVRC